MPPHPTVPPNRVIREDDVPQRRPPPPPPDSRDPGRAVKEGGLRINPSPAPGQPLPQRRMEDTKNYAGEWTIMLLSLMGWATTFCVDMAVYEDWHELMTPKFLGLHIAQLFTVTTSILAAKRIR